MLMRNWNSWNSEKKTTWRIHDQESQAFKHRSRKSRSCNFKISGHITLHGSAYLILVLKCPCWKIARSHSFYQTQYSVHSRCSHFWVSPHIINQNKNGNQVFFSRVITKCILPSFEYSVNVQRTWSAIAGDEVKWRHSL